MNNIELDLDNENEMTFNVIIEGKMVVNNQTLSAGDIFVFDPYVVSECTFLEDTKLIAVRDSSFPNDKYSAE